MTPRPGEISMAHGGVLFLDELAEFPRNVLEVLRQPLEEHQIHIARNYGNFTFPAEFMLVAAMNPCPCGNYPDMQKCSCTPSQIQKYLGKISTEKKIRGNANPYKLYAWTGRNQDLYSIRQCGKKVDGEGI